MSGQFGPANPNWKGGRTVASNGYVLVKDRDNPMADVRGYVYEHRLVMSKEVGRPLLTEEQVHHDDRVKVNNEVTNLELCDSIGHHRARHRTRERGLRLPGQPNPTVVCDCGCGTPFERFDSSGRPRRFMPGHNPVPAPTAGALLAALRDGPKTRRDLIERTGRPVHAVATCLSKLKRTGKIEQIGHGIWRLRAAA